MNSRHFQSKHIDERAPQPDYDLRDVNLSSGIHSQNTGYGRDDIRSGGHVNYGYSTSPNGYDINEPVQLRQHHFNPDRGNPALDASEQYLQYRKNRRSGKGIERTTSINSTSGEAFDNATLGYRQYNTLRRLVKRRHSSRRSKVGEPEPDYEGLPSLHRQKPKTLNQRLTDKYEDLRSTTHDIAETMRNRILKDPVKKLSGYSLWKYKQAVTWQKFKFATKNALYHLKLWSSSFKLIEGRFGSATLSYFKVIRWLMFLNLFIMVVMFGVIIIPHLILKPHSFKATVPTINATDLQMKAQTCSSSYAEFVQNFTENQERDFSDNIVDFLQGTGWLERTVLFIGVYYNKTYPITVTMDGEEVEDSEVYNMSLAYVLATGTCFLISFFLIIKNSAKGVKEGLLEQESTLTQYSDKVFCGWDYCITDKKGAKLKGSNVYQELTSDLMYQRITWKKQNRKALQWCRLYFVRFIINILVIAILGGSLYLIYFTNQQLLMINTQTLDPFVALVVQFMPSITISILNFAIPELFAKIVILEDYLPGFEIKITLVRVEWVGPLSNERVNMGTLGRGTVEFWYNRTSNPHVEYEFSVNNIKIKDGPKFHFIFMSVLLRLASLAILMISLYIQLISQPSPVQSDCGNHLWSGSTNSSTVVKCWETYVGQQIYKLVLLDFLVIVFVTFFVEFPRKLVFDRFNTKSKLVTWLGQQEFDLQKNVLDIIYSQTLCWLGLFFSPFIPIMCVLKCFIFFYVKKLTVLQNCIPPLRPYRTSKLNSFFMTVLLLSFVLTCIPIGYMIGSINTSQSCGPFRVYSTENFVVFTTITDMIHRWPIVARDIFMFLGTVGFFIPAVIILGLFMYYYWAVAHGHKRLELLLKGQLKLEGKDKQFLLARVNEVLALENLGHTD